MSIFASQRQDQEKDEYAKEREVMDELDENGWAQIHHSAFHGFTKSVERFVAASEDQLEFPTNDHNHMTPLLLAVGSGQFDTAKRLVDLGADLRFLNQLNVGVIELAAQKGDLRMINYFLDINHKDCPVWSRLVKFVVSDQDDNAESAGRMVHELTKGEGSDRYWGDLLAVNAVPILLKVIQSLVSDKAKFYAFSILLNLIAHDEVKEEVVKAQGIQTSLKKLQTKDKDLLLVSSTLLCHLASVEKYVDRLVAEGAINALIKLWQDCGDIKVLIQATNALSYIAAAKKDYKQTVGTTPECFPALVKLFSEHRSKDLLMALTMSASTVVSRDESNQNGFANEGGATALIELANDKDGDIQLNAIKGIHMLAKDNPHTQEMILEQNGVEPLLLLLKRSSTPDTQVCCASALWALAGDDIERCRYMARGIGVNLLIDFLNAQEPHDILHYIGAEGLGVLAHGPHNKQDVIARANGVQPLVRLLRSPKKNIVLSAIRALRNLCVGIGYIPHHTNQMSILSARGIRYLVALMVHSRNELVRVESALTLGCCAVGNTDVMTEISDSLDFNYIHILRLLYSKDSLVRLLAGGALAAFSYNNLGQQQEIEESGGVRHHCFVPFLESSDEFYRSNAAFQVVVLSRIIPDEDQASSSAEGIKLLVDLLHQSKNDLILALTADCLARICHTRAGIPAAVISVGGIDLLCNLMLVENEQVSGAAAIALGYLSFNFMAERILLNKCRIDPLLYKLLRHYTANYRISKSFIKEYKHYKHIGLPPIDANQKTSLVSQKNIPLIKGLNVIEG
ncbi:ankyrin and armadillo repeat-containing protein-like isoform X2 [Apostichopus japonicus]|uniref:ankyrin and armadillo repeat-containing protein-like isoform X2 n=1 Tax=Stichopus japonicus TaxID=307972 RepID=UPI003AB17815